MDRMMDDDGWLWMIGGMMMFILLMSQNDDH